MHVIGSLYVLLGISTIQLQNSVGNSREFASSVAGFSSQNDDLAWAVYYRRAEFCCAFFLWAKGLNAKNIHNEIFPIYSGKCLSRKAVRNCVVKFSLRHSKVAHDARPGAEVAETTVKRLLCCWFQRAGKAMGQAYQYWGRICREMFLLLSNHMFYILYPIVIHLLTRLWCRMN
jgi:hypothetical protein